MTATWKPLWNLKPTGFWEEGLVAELWALLEIDVQPTVTQREGTLAQVSEALLWPSSLLLTHRTCQSGYFSN